MVGPEGGSPQPQPDRAKPNPQQFRLDRRIMLWEKELPITPLQSAEAREDAMKVAGEVSRVALEKLAGRTSLHERVPKGTLGIVDYSKTADIPVSYVEEFTQPEVIEAFMRTSNREGIAVWVNAYDTTIDPVMDEPAQTTEATLKITMTRNEHHRSLKTWLRQSHYSQSQTYVLYPDRVVKVTHNYVFQAGAERKIAPRGPRAEKHEANRDELTELLHHIQV